ncbi:hypothetical protein Tco_1010396, partial [Tanacetum coccineum]
KVENFEDEDDCSIDFEIEFPAIVFNNTLTTIPSEPTVCPPYENKVDFIISLEESDDEDYTVIFDENSFSNKIISVNDLKTDSENDNMPSSPNTTVDYLDDLDYFRDFKNEFPAIVYNDGLTSKSDHEINPKVSFERIDKFNLIDEALLSEYDEKIVSRFNDLFNIIHPNDLKSEKENDDNDIEIIQSSEDNEITHGKNRLSKTSHDKTIRTFETGSFVIEVNIMIWEYYVIGMLFFLIINLYVPFGIPFDSKRYYKDGSHTNVAEAKVHIAPLPAADQRHPWLRYQIQEYTKEIRRSYEQRIDTIWSRPVNRVHVLDFEGLTPEMRQDLAMRLRMVYSREGQQGMSDIEMGLDVADTLGQAPKKVTDVDIFYLRSMDRGTTNALHLLTQYLFRHAEGRKSGARLSGGHFIGYLAMHFRLVSDKGLRGLQVVTRELSLIDLHELGRINICTRYGDTWAWLAQGPEWQQATAAGAHEADEAGPVAKEGAQEILVPVPAPAPTQAPPPAPQHRTMS